MQPADIEKFVLWSLDHTGWHSSLWFPDVRREHINFPGGPTDAEIHAALFALIRKGSVTVSSPAGGASAIAGGLTPEMLQDLEADGQPLYTLDLEEGIRGKLHAALERSRLPHRGHFELFAHGDEFDAKAYLKSASLDFDRVWHRRESGSRTSGVGKRLGDGAVISLDEQQRVAIEYLSTNRDSLRELANFPGVATFILGLQYNTSVAEGLRGFCMSPSPALMLQALDIGIQPTFYVVLHRPGEDDRGFSLDTFLRSW
jgi:hypothetical protein